MTLVISALACDWAAAARDAWVCTPTLMVARSGLIVIVPVPWTVMPLTSPVVSVAPRTGGVSVARDPASNGPPSTMATSATAAIAVLVTTCERCPDMDSSWGFGRTVTAQTGQLPPWFRAPRRTLGSAALFAGGDSRLRTRPIRNREASVVAAWLA